MVLYEDNKEKYDAVPKDLFHLVQRNEEIHDTEFKTKPIGFFMDVWLRFVKNKASVVAAIIILLISFFAVFGPSMNGYTYNEQNTELTNMPPKVPFIAKMNLGFFDGGFTLENRKYDNLNDPEKYPDGCVLEVLNPRLVNGERIVDVVVDYYKYKGLDDDQCFWFGSDYLGRDIWTRMWRGARVSLIIAIVSVCCNVFIGVVYGSIAGYYGGKVDMVMQRITEILSSLPTLVVVTLMLVVMKPGLGSIIIALMLTGWINMSRIVRAQVLKLKDQEFVLAARTLGVSNRDILFKEILPNSLGQIIITFMFSIPNAIFLEAFLAFVGLGVPAPMASLGSLINDGYKSAMTYPHMVAAPVIVLGVLMLGFNLFADGLRDAIDPQLKQM